MGSMPHEEKQRQSGHCDVSSLEKPLADGVGGHSSVVELAKHTQNPRFDPQHCK